MSVDAKTKENYITTTSDKLIEIEKRLACLEMLFKEHLRATRQSCLQEVGFLETAMDMEPRTAELRAKNRNDGG